MTLSDHVYITMTVGRNRCPHKPQHRFTRWNWKKAYFDKFVAALLWRCGKANIDENTGAGEYVE